MQPSARTWLYAALTTLIVVAAVAPAAWADDWSANQEISSVTSRDAEQLTVDSNSIGDFVATWLQSVDDDVAVVFKPFASGVGTPQEFAGTYDAPDVAVGGNSVATLGFDEPGGPRAAATSKASGSTAFNATPAFFIGDGHTGPTAPPSAGDPLVEVTDSGTGILAFEQDYYNPPSYSTKVESVQGRILANPTTNTWTGSGAFRGDSFDLRAGDLSVATDGSTFYGSNSLSVGPCWYIAPGLLEQGGSGSGGDHLKLGCSGNPYAGVIPSFDRLPNGDVVMAYRKNDESNIYVIDFSKARAQSGSSSPTAVKINPGNDQRSNTNPRLRTDAAGNAIVVWYDSDTGTGTPKSLLARFRPVGGAWGPVEVINSGEDYEGSFDLDVDATGNGYVVYERTNPTTGDQEIAAAERTPGASGGWSVAELLSEEQGTVSSPRVAAGRNGQAFASWIANSSDAVFYAVNSAPVCSDGLDNDGDGKVDHPADPGCASAADTDETDAAAPPAGDPPSDDPPAGDPPAGDPPPVGDPPAGEELDTTAPTGSVKTKRRYRAGRPIKLTVVSDEDGKVVARGKQVQTSAGSASVSAWAWSAKKRKRVKVKLKPVRRSVAAGVPEKLKLKPKGRKNRKKAKQLRRVVNRRGAKAKAKITVVFRDEAGNRSRKKLKLRLR